MKTKLTLSVIILFVLSLQAQSYEFSVDENIYVELEKGVPLINQPLWDDPEIPIPIEIDFTFFDNRISNLFLIVDGVLSTEDFESYSYNPYDVIAPFVVDQMDRSNDPNMNSPDVSLSEILSVVEGEVGNRIQKIEWKNIGFLGDIVLDNISSDFVNYQLWLYEESGMIEIHFGDMKVDNPIVSYGGGSGPAIVLASEIDEDTEQVKEFVFLVGDPNNPSLVEVDDYNSIGHLY